MSVIVNLAIFPMDQGVHLSTYVARALDIISASGLEYQLGPMGTAIEGEYDEVMGVVRKCFLALADESDRIYMTMAVDARSGAAGRLKKKVDAVERAMN